jgi:hypothetical protein
VEVDDGKGGGKSGHGEGRGNRNEGNGDVLHLQGMFHQIGDASGAEYDDGILFSFPHHATDPLQACVGGVDVMGGQGKVSGEVRPAAGDACLTQQGTELFVDLCRRAFGAFLVNAVHEDANAPACRKACPKPA